MSNHLNLTGKRFGRLVAQWPAARGNYCSIRWLCLCDCGNLKVVSREALMRGYVKSCSCLVKTAGGMQKHSPTTPTQHSWKAMKLRCLNPNATAYNLYGGRGVTICKRWLKFEGFLADMGERPIGTTLDRFPNPSGNYEPGNCRWATLKQQRNNRVSKS